MWMEPWWIQFWILTGVPVSIVLLVIADRFKFGRKILLSVFYLAAFIFIFWRCR